MLGRDLRRIASENGHYVVLDPNCTKEPRISGAVDYESMSDKNIEHGVLHQSRGQGRSANSQPGK